VDAGGAAGGFPGADAEVELHPYRVVGVGAVQRDIEFVVVDRSTVASRRDSRNSSEASAVAASLARMRIQARASMTAVASSPPVRLVREGRRESLDALSLVWVICSEKRFRDRPGWVML